ncbi:MAG: hypothetical protein ACI857_002094 [Arenicella sp.]|jgi:hypothetical protein
MKKALLLSILLCLGMLSRAQTTWQVCVEDPPSTTCPGKTGTFTPGNLVILQGDMIQFNTTMVLLSGYAGTFHDIQFSGSPANNVMLLVSSNILSQNTSVTTLPFNTPGIFPMECANFNHCILSEYSCTGYTVEVQAACTVTANFTTTSLNFCSGDVINFTNTSTGATSYEWHLDEFTFATSTDAVLSFGSTATHDIELIADDGAGCLDSTTITITIDQASDAGSDNDDIFCNINDSVDLNTLLDADLGGNWTETTASGQFNSTSGFLDYTDLSEDDYSFEYVVPGVGVCPNDTAIIDIEINQEPLLTFNFNGANIALSDSFYVDFTTTNVNGGATYIWDFCDATLLTYNSPFWYTWTTPGDYCVCVQVNNGNGCVETFCDSNIVVFDDSGFDDLENLSFEMYPNPASGSVNFSLDNFQDVNSILLFDLNGKLILEQQANGNSKLEIDVSNLSSGLYTVRVISEAKVESAQLIIRQ